MEAKTRQTIRIFLGVALIGVNLILFNAVLGRSGIRLRTDLTEGNVYTINQVTKDFLRDLDRPAEIIFYYSSPDSMPPMIRPLVDPLKDAIAELATESSGKVTARFVALDTRGKKAQDDAADAYGVRALSIPVSTATEQSVKNVYFSVVVTSGDRFEHIALSRTCPLIRISEDLDTFGIKLELTDPEYVLANTLRRVVQTYGSVSGALMAEDLSVKLTAYISDRDSLPENMADLAETVREVDTELNDDAPGRFELEVVDPWKDARSLDEKQRAAEALFEKTGVRPLRGATTDFYAWLVIEVGDEREYVELYKPSGSVGKADLKTAVEGSLKRLVPGFLPTVGIVSPTPPRPANPMMMQQQPPDAFQVTREVLAESFEVEQVTLASGIGRDVDILLVLQPGDLSEAALYELDQFVMRGGRLVLCGGGYHGDLGSRGRIAVQRSGSGVMLSDWLNNFGIDLRHQMVMDSASDRFAFPIIDESVFPPMVEVVEVKYPFFITMDQARMSDQNPITAFQQGATFLWASPVGLKDVPDGAEGTVLMRTTPEASVTSSPELVGQILDVGYDPGLGAMGRVGSVMSAVWSEMDRAVQTEGPFPPDYLASKLRWVLDLETEQLPLAVAVTGQFSSYFKDKPVPGAAPAPSTPEDKDAEEGAKEPRRQRAPLEESRRPGSIVVFGDSDAFSWLAFRAYSLDERSWETNMGLLQKALEWSAGDELAPIRGRRSQHRPLAALNGLDPDERDASVSRARWVTFSGTLGFILVFATCWWCWRRSRPAMRLDPVSRPAPDPSSDPQAPQGETP